MEIANFSGKSLSRFREWYCLNTQEGISLFFPNPEMIFWSVWIISCCNGRACGFTIFGIVIGPLYKTGSSVPDPANQQKNSKINGELLPSSTFSGANSSNPNLVCNVWSFISTSCGVFESELIPKSFAKNIEIRNFLLQTNAYFQFSQPGKLTGAQIWQCLELLLKTWVVLKGRSKRLICQANEDSPLPQLILTPSSQLLDSSLQTVPSPHSASCSLPVQSQYR